MMTLTVYDLVNYLKNQLDSNPRIQNILISGEISNFTNHFNGHLYFSLKDDNAKINCVMFKTYASRLNFNPKNGDKVIVKANTSVYVASGSMQLIVSEMKPDGLGELYLKYEALKKKLANEGYFDENHKKDIPNYPMNIAILVGDKSAALSDIKTCLKRRWPIANADIYPCLVQGEGSSKDIINNLLKVDKMNYDAIVLARGGGSIEDLWSFNDEELAKTIYHLNTFIVTGVGHEQDYTIVDFVSDLRAPTPTAAIELLVPNIKDVLNYLGKYNENIYTIMNNLISDISLIIDKINNSIIFKNPYYIIQNQAQTFDNLSLRLLNYDKKIKNINNEIDLLNNKMSNSINNYIINKTKDIDYLKTILIKTDILKIDKRNIEINYLKNNMFNYINQYLNNLKLKYKRFDTLLHAYGFQESLNRGFSIIKYQDKVIKDSKDINIDDMLDIKLAKGNIKALVKEIMHD